MSREIDNFYLQLTLINDEKEKLIEFLENNNIIYEEYQSGWRIYLEEEAEFFLDNHLCDCYSGNELTAIIMNHKTSLASEFSYCDSFDCDIFDELARDYCYENIEKYKEMIDGE